MLSSIQCLRFVQFLARQHTPFSGSTLVLRVLRLAPVAAAGIFEVALPRGAAPLVADGAPVRVERRRFEGPATGGRAKLILISALLSEVLQ